MGKGIKQIKSLKVNPVPLSHHLGLSKFGWERIGLNVKLCSMLLKLNLLDSDYSRHMTWDKSSFTSLENYDGRVVTFGDGSLACVKGKGSIVISGYSKLDGVLYVKGLKLSLLTISQMCDKYHRVNFC